MTVRMIRALAARGRRRNGTEPATDSTPVTATAPEENARSTRIARAMPVQPPSGTSTGRTSQSAEAARSRVPVADWYRPVPIMASSTATNRYVGTAAARPMNRSPRRFRSPAIRIPASAISSRKPISPGNAAARYCAAADMDTATTRVKSIISDAPTTTPARSPRLEVAIS